MTRLTPPAAAAALLCGAVLAATAAAAPGDIELVSRNASGAPASGASDHPAISPDGRLVFFQSAATNLEHGAVVPSDGYVRDLGSASTAFLKYGESVTFSAGGRFVAGTLRKEGGFQFIVRRDLITGAESEVAYSGNPSRPGPVFPDGPSISGDGSTLVFTRTVGSSDGGPVGVFVKRFADASLTLVSRRSGATGTQALDVAAGAISANGRYVVFESADTDLAPGDSAGTSDVWIRDLQTDETSLVSRGPGATGVAGDRDSFDPSISDDGRYVAFSSYAKNFASDDTDDLPSVYVRDRVAGTTTLVSRASGSPGAPADNDAFEADISGDGRFVAFTSAASNLGPDGGSGSRDVFVRDLATSTTTLVSRAGGQNAQGRGPVPGPGFGNTSEEPSISDDGRYVAFLSDAPFAQGAFAGVNVYRRDLGPPAPVPVAGGGGAGGGGGAAPGRRVRCGGLLATKVGTAGRDVIRGTRRRDVIAALGGNDTVVGLGGDDVICLGAGDDTADGGAGRDRIIGGGGADRLAGGAGRDLLDGGAGADVLKGGPGIDRLVGRAGADTLLGGAARDALIGGAGRNRLTQ